MNDIHPVPYSLGIPLIYLQSNLREIGGWNDTHGAAIIACLTLFAGSFNFGVLGSSHPYDYLRLPWGSNPITDPLLSSDVFRLYNFGGGYSRMEKLQQLSDWPVSYECVRVCTKLFNKNCGACEKCMRTKLCYWTLNKPIPKTFLDTRIRPFDVIRILAFKEQEIKDYRSVYHAARRRSKRSAIVFSLAINIALNRSIRYIEMLFPKLDIPPKMIKRVKKLFTN